MPIRNKVEQNSYRRPMSVPDMHFEVSKDNKRVLEYLDERKTKKQKIGWWKKNK